MTCDDLYGTESKIGLLQNMLNDSTKESEFYLLVECGRNIPAECMNWPLSTLFGVNRRLIVTTQQLTQASPRWASDVVFFHLESGNNWKLFLSHCLEGCFLGDTVFSVMEVVLPAVFDCLSPFARDVDSEDSEISYCDEFLAACQLSVSLYSKWCGFVDQVSFPDINLNDEGMHEDNLFALQCAVFAVCWALGWQAQPDLQMNVQHTLLELEKDLQQIASSFNSPDKVLPPCGEGDPSIFSLLCTRYGWKTFEEAEKLGFPRRWSTFKHVHPTTHGWSQFFPLPSRSLRLSAAEYLLDCGQSVWLQGDSVSGKTFLLQSIRHCERWVPLYMSGSKSFSASSAQENILDRIYLRSTHQYGPTVGKKLIVSIDDVHLTTGALGGDCLLSPTAGVAGALVAFITKHSTICIPRLGLTPITDTAFLLSSNEVSNIDLAVRRSVVNFLLPAFEGEELFEGVQRLFEVTCARKRLASFPEQWAEVIAKAHFLFVRAAYPSQREELTVDPLASTIGQPAFQHIEKLMSCEVRDLFRVVDSVKQVLLSPLTDAQVFETGAVTVFNYYASALNQNNVTDEEMEKMKEEFGTAASNVLLEGKAKEGEGPVRKALKLKSNTNFSVDTATDADKETVAEWIVELEVAHERIIEEPLQNLYSKGGERVDADGNSASSVILTDDTTIISSITATKNTATDAAKPSALEVEKDRVQRQRSRASSLFQKRQSAAYSSRTGSIVSEEKLPPPKSPLSPTRLTTWLTIHAKQLVSAGRASVQQHRIIASESDFGIRRLLRIVSCALHFPLVLLQNNHDGVETFKKEMTALIRLALSTDTRIMVYVPKDLLLVPQVAEMIDKIMRVGDAGDMFSHPERFTLSKGYQLSQQRSLRAQILLDDYELRPRVRRCFFFVLHTESATTKNSLSPLYPGFDAVPVVELYPPCLEEKLYRELAKGVLLGNQPSGSDPAWESEVSSALKGEKMVDAVCSVFQCVKTRFPDTTTDLLITYSLLLKNLLTNVLSTIKTQTSQVETVLRRGDEASTQLKKDSAALKELGTDLVNLKKRMAAQETCLAEDEEAERVLIEKAQKEEEQLKTEEQEIFNAEADVTEKERQSTENLEAARSSLRRVKLTHIRSMSSMRVIEKGSLLIKGIYKVLGEDVPKHNNSPSELWNIGVKMICSQEFVKRFIAVSPDTIEDINTYLPIQQDLSEVRYNNASPSRRRCQSMSLHLLSMHGRDW
ncbi:hypothetical protein AGDE_14406 [Angomonas deanei]|uniref:P-loop containing dynein motor region containing protein, putative n=1 Tax=Angomonas deanei TaxID=59799 RepID=A0A7G2CT51_9TRYP|nr:hypothetical protein AGDE_14406 [Angomonas deanei]CAD2222114.1 P-loop containing dynein motor region containing protein, putative [Angomonas deanei]|eukprot:EPY20913.1 hypothetical protein AGDE_14406 [Angomonas deanei]